MTLAGASCLHGTPKLEFPRQCPCTKTDVSYQFWKLQAWSLEHRLLTPGGGRRNCILGARIQYASILSIVRAWSWFLVRLVFLWIFSYHIYCVIVSYRICIHFYRTLAVYFLPFSSNLKMLWCHAQFRKNCIMGPKSREILHVYFVFWWI
jgi:hypothetical protein